MATEKTWRGGQRPAVTVLEHLVALRCPGVSHAPWDLAPGWRSVIICDLPLRTNLSFSMQNVYFLLVVLHLSGDDAGLL